MSELLSTVIKVRHNGVRSVNVERDLHDPNIAKGYVITSQALKSLTRILSGMNGTGSSRSWTLTGPYGSGKSFFSLFLMNLVSSHQSAHDFVWHRLRAADLSLVERVMHTVSMESTKGLLAIPVTGYRAPLQECLRNGLLRALQPFSKLKEVEHALDNLTQQEFKYNSRTFTHLMQRLLDIVTQPSVGYRGILLIFDELGKALEYAAAHPSSTDIYLLQEIAEFANRSGEQPFVFIATLHQAFERYATFLDSATQREWAKVQGRFEDIAFQEPPTQQMRLLVNALEISPEYRDQLEPLLEQTAANFATTDWNPPLMRAEEFYTLCKNSYPLHPSVLVALPYVFRRLAQNERSIFAFLTSQEPRGFQDFLDTHTLPAFLHLFDVFDYLVANFQARLYASGRAHILTEALERLNNTPDLDPVECEVLKTIALLNWLGEISHLRATEPILLAALPSNKRSAGILRKALRSLKDKKVIVYRRFDQTYSVWQGSDIDIEERLEEASRKISSSFSLAEAVQRYLPPRPLVARRHSYQTGTIRYFEVSYVDATNITQIALDIKPGRHGLILLCLPVNRSEADTFAAWAQQPPLSTRKDIVVGIAGRTTRLTELLQELRYLHWVAENTPDLSGDAIARRELRVRLSTIENLINNELESVISLHKLGDPSYGQWFHKGEVVQPRTHLSLNHLLSQICDDLYSHTPRIWNELINRRELSSQAAAARRNLLEGMLQRANQEILGITGYPPERSMYESLLRAGGLHRQDEQGNWVLTDPPEEDPIHIRAAWEAIADFIFKPPAEPRPVTALYDHLRQPPFGLTEGVLPILLCAFMIVHQNETTFYREGSLRIELEIADWEVLLRRPELFSVAGCRIEGPRAYILERFGKGLGVKAEAMSVVRALFRNLKSLPDYAWRTQRLPDQVLAVRKAIETARSPERLLFHDLPEALELPPFDNHDVDYAHTGIYFDRLNHTLHTLATVMPKMREQARDHFLASCGLPIGESGWQTFLSLAVELLPRTSDPTLLHLLRRTVETSDTSVALENLFAFIADRPLHSWTDLDTDRFLSKSQHIGGLIRHARNGYSIFPDVPSEKHQRVRDVVKALQSYVQGLEDDQQVLEYALYQLIREIRSQQSHVNG